MLYREESHHEATDTATRANPKPSISATEQIVEIVSDSGEGAQTAGQSFGRLCARMGNGVWTVEIIPAEIEPPSRSRAGASGNRIRFGSGPITNAGNTADLVIAFNEQCLYSRIDQQALRQGTRVLLDNHWAEDQREEVRMAYHEAVADFLKLGYDVIPVPMEQECLKLVPDPRRGKNVWVLGLLCRIYKRDLELAAGEIRAKFTRKGEAVVKRNLDLLEAGFEWAGANLDLRIEVKPIPTDQKRVVMNGNQALALGCMAAGMEMCAMYPITPATSVSHYLAANFKEVGGFVHQAEDEIAAIGFAIGASFAGKTALTVTSGPGLALKNEFIGLAVMAEIPLVIVDVQRGGPSTGLPTKVEQSDLLSVLYAGTGDTPKIVIAPSTIEECFHFMITARQLAETFRGPVFVLSDANLATGVQPFNRPEPKAEWLAPPIDQGRWDAGVKPYDWDAETGLSPRPVPGQRDGNYVVTGLSHDAESHVAYESGINQISQTMRSKKLQTLQKSLEIPEVLGEQEGDLLVVGWGSTRGAIEEATAAMRAQGKKVSSVHLRFISPLEPGLEDIFKRFRKVITVEINYSDEPTPGAQRRLAQLAMLLRAYTLVDIECWSKVPGTPLQPDEIRHALEQHLAALGGEVC